MRALLCSADTRGGCLHMSCGAGGGQQVPPLRRRCRSGFGRIDRS
jgi:hypothetical protein